MKNKGVTTTGSRPIAICTQPGRRECRVHFLWLLYFTKNKQIKLFSPFCRSSVIFTREESELSAGTVVASTHYSYKSPDKTNAWTIFNLATANKWSDLNPPRPHVRSHLPVKNALNLVSKFSLLGDDRKELTERLSDHRGERDRSDFRIHSFTNSCTFAPNTRPVTSPWTSHTSSSFLKLKPQGNDVWEFPTVLLWELKGKRLNLRLLKSKDIIRSKLPPTVQ